MSEEKEEKAFDEWKWVHVANQREKGRIYRFDQWEDMTDEEIAREAWMARAALEQAKC